MTVKTYGPNGSPTDAEFLLSYLTDEPRIRADVAWAFVDPAGAGASFTPDPAFQFSTNGGTITVDRTGPHQNQFLVRMPGFDGFGVVHASADNGNHIAVVNYWTVLNGELRASVELFTPGGAPANDGAFTIQYRRGGSYRERGADLWADSPTLASYTPYANYLWNANRPDPMITRSGVGRYRVRLPGLQPLGFERGHVQLTPYGGSLLYATHVVTSSTNGSVFVDVRCFGVNGAPTDGRFVLSYHETAAPIAERDGSGGHVWANDATAASYTPSAAYTDSNGTVGPSNAELVERLAVGQYRVSLPDLPPLGSTVQVTAYGSLLRHATVRRWVPRPGGGTEVYVETFDRGGLRSDARFNLSYLADTPALGPLATTTSSGTGCNGAVLTPRNRPVQCTDWQLFLSGLPANALIGFVQVDLTSVNVPLGPAAPGCTQYTRGAVTQLVVLPVQNPAYSLAIPAFGRFTGLTVHAQGGALVPGINALGLAASNRVSGTLGEY